MNQMANQVGFKANLHVHSRFSDGGNSPEEIVEEAVRKGFDFLGFADHFSPGPSPWLYPGCYLTTKGIKPYVETLSKLRTQYQDEIIALIGLEIYAIGSSIVGLPFDEFKAIDLNMK